MNIEGIITVHMLSVGDMAILESERNVDVDLTLSTSFQSIMIWSDNRVTQVNMAHSLVGVEEVQFTELEDQNIVAIFLNRKVIFKPVLGGVSFMLMELPISGILDSFGREVWMTIWVVSYLGISLEVFVLI